MYIAIRSLKDTTKYSELDEQMDFLKEVEISETDSEQNIQQKDFSRVSSEKEIENFPEILLIVDTETTGLDPINDFCLEVGAILFDVKSRSVLIQQSFLLPVENNDAEFVNRIPAVITNINQPWKKGLEYFSLILEHCDAVVAHNAAFDKQWFGKYPLPVINKKWICSMDDITWPSQKLLKNRPSVRDLALAYEVPVWGAHRALTDCTYISEVFKRCDDLEALLCDAVKPRRLTRAEVSYEDRWLAKKAGFSWNNPIPGAWTKRLSEKQISRLDFPVTYID